MADASVAAQLGETIERYLASVLQAIPSDRPYIERRLISDEKWQKYPGDSSFRYSGVLREYEPDLPTAAWASEAKDCRRKTET